MVSIRQALFIAFAFIFLGAFSCPRSYSQAALLMEEPYGFFGILNPTGHNAIYFERICAETPVKLRRCQAGELGAVIARYQGIEGYDWIAIPLLPYLYAVENPSDVPARVDHEMVERMRSHYREEHLQSLSPDLPAGSFVRGGWTQLVGAAYERRIYAFRFNTTAEQDDALIARMNSGPNKTKFNLLYENCADFARVVLNSYFPHTFHRSIFPDIGMTTPKQISYKLVRYARKHPNLELTVFEIPQVPGYRRKSRSIKGIDESFVTTAYAVPLVLTNPYIAVGLFIDYVLRGRYRTIPEASRSSGTLTKLSALTAGPPTPQKSASAATQATSAVPDGTAAAPHANGANYGLKEIGAADE